MSSSPEYKGEAGSLDSLLNQINTDFETSVLPVQADIEYKDGHYLIFDTTGEVMAGENGECWWLKDGSGLTPSSILSGTETTLQDALGAVEDWYESR